jgi:hypothetical protein
MDDDVLEIQDNVQTIEEMADDITAILMGEEPKEGGQDDGDAGTTGGGSSDGSDYLDSLADSEGDKDSAGGEDGEGESEESEEDDGEDDAKQTDVLDETPPSKKMSAQDRIRQLVDQKNDLKKQVEDARRELEETQSKFAQSSDKHPDPEKELADLHTKYSSILSPAEVLEKGLINPLTNEPFTAAEAQAAVAELKQDVQFQINEANNAVVDRMNQARLAEERAEELRVPLAELLNKYPQLDRDSKDCNPDLCDMLQAVIDANAVIRGGLLSGFKTEPKDFIAKFGRVLDSQTHIRVNTKRDIDKNIERVPARSSLDNRQEPAKMKPEDDLMAAFDEAMKEMGA